MQKITKNSISVAADHRAIGQHLGLFFFDASSPGSAFFLDNGMRIVDKLKSVLKFHQPQMKLVSTPTLFDTRLWSQSGHWQNYKENIFILETDHPDQSEKSTFAIKPMNCPAHCLIFKRETRSYRDLPLRLQEFDALHRNEASGALSGLVRVKKFHQDDGHIFCTRSQIYDEIKSTLEVIHTLYKNVFKFKEYSLALSTRPTDHLGTVQDYEGAQEILSNVLKDSGRDFFIKEGDGAFYGPKIDIQVTDSIGRNHQLATIQLDFQLPERFDLEYVGSIERFLAILLEHYNGKLPFWINPRQAMIISTTPNAFEYAQEIQKDLSSQKQRNGLFYYCNVDNSDRTLSKKVREAVVDGYSYVIVVGEREMSNKTVFLKKREDIKAAGAEMTLDQVRELFQDLDQNYL